MAINKKLIHFDLFSDFSSKKLSANKENTKYTLGVDGAIKSGSPDILWHSICWIKDKGKMWTHGRLYDCSPFVNSIEGKINLSSITEIKSAQSKLTQTNEVAYYLITDSSGRLPSTETCYDIPSDCVKQLSMRSPDTLSNSALALATSVKDVSPIGVNVGDLIAITRVKVGVSDLASALGITLNLGSEVEIYQYKVLSTNDVKAPDTPGTEVGVMGLASPWDKQQINKIPTIESNLSTTASELNRGNKKQVFDADNYNIDRCLNAGIYKYGRTGRSMPDNHSDEYYIVDADTRYNRSDSLYYVTQKVYSVNYPNRAFERLITTTSIDNYNGTYSDWVQIGKDSYTRNEIETNYATKTYVGEQISGLVGTAPDTLDTIYELSAALKDNKDIVDVLEESIANKADTSAIPTKVSQLTNDSGYITSVAKGTATTQATAQTLMCDVNINGKTVTPVKFNGTVGSSTMPVYMAGGKPTQISSFPEAYLSWGGKNYYSSYGPIDAALADVLRANRFDGLPAECITVEYSRDGGATWFDYGATDKMKVDLVSQTTDNAYLYIGKNDTDNPVNTNHKLRVIINSWKANSAQAVYTSLQKFIIYVGSSSTTFNNMCTIKTRTRGDFLSGNDNWVIKGKDIKVDGWSGYNVLNVSFTLGSNNSQNTGDIGEVMFEFSISNPPASGLGLSILKIFAYGGVGWKTPSNMAAIGRLYSYDYQQNVKFPAKVNAIGGLQENGTNLSAKYLGINATANSAKSISDGTNSYTPSAIKTMEANLEDVISDVVSIDTSLFPTSTDEVIGFRQTNGGDGVGYSEAWLDRLKGNTVVWNQTYPTEWTSNNQGVTSVSTNGLITLNGTTSTSYFNIKNGVGYSDIPTNHTGLYVLKVIKDDDKYLQSKKIGLLNRGKYAAIDNNFASFFYTNKDTTSAWSLGVSNLAKGDVITDIQIRVSIYDLTQMFGAGNEPTTIEEFNARKPLGIDEYTYNEGELISTTADEIKSVGFNAWDEQWEVGAITDDGSIDRSRSNRRTTSFIKVIENSVYYFKAPNAGGRIAFYDDDKQLVLYDYNGVNSNTRTYEIPVNAAYMRYTLHESYGTTYNHDICIHLVHTGTRNGQYEPYKEYRLPLPIKDIKDKDGNQLFPNGLLSAGTAYDEITATKAIKRIGVVDMGTLTWNMDDAYESFNLVSNVRNYGFRAAFNSATKANLTNPIYPVSTTGGSDKNTDKTIKLYDVAGLRVKDTSYTSAATFKAAMSGVMLYYELAEPIEVDIEEWDRRYEVSDFGTEEVVSDTPTTPLKADIIYEYNAKGRIEANERGIEELNDKIVEINEKVGEMNGLSISADKIWSEENPVDITLGDVDNDAFLPEGYGLAGGHSRVARMYVKFTSTATTYEGEFLSSYNDNCLIIGVKGYYELTAPNGTMLKRGYLGDSSVKVEQIGSSGWKFDFAALDMEEGMKVHVGAMLDCIDID